MKTIIKYIMVLFVLSHGSPVWAQKTVIAPCCDFILTTEGKTDTNAVLVSGRVYDLWGRGVAYHVVQIGTYTAVTDTNGHYGFTYIAPGTYEVYGNNFCPLSGRKVKFRKKQKLKMDICVTVQKEEHPGLGIPDGKK